MKWAASITGDPRGGRKGSDGRSLSLDGAVCSFLGATLSFSRGWTPEGSASLRSQSNDVELSRVIGEGYRDARDKWSRGTVPSA